MKMKPIVWKTEEVVTRSYERIAYCPECDSPLKSVYAGGYKGLAFKCVKCPYRHGAKYKKGVLV